MNETGSYMETVYQPYLDFTFNQFVFIFYVILWPYNWEMKKFKNFNNFVTKIEKIGILCTLVITVILPMIILYNTSSKLFEKISVSVPEGKDLFFYFIFYESSILYN